MYFIYSSIFVYCFLIVFLFFYLLLFFTALITSHLFDITQGARKSNSLTDWNTFRKSHIQKSSYMQHNESHKDMQTSGVVYTCLFMYMNMYLYIYIYFFFPPFFARQGILRRVRPPLPAPFETLYEQRCDSTKAPISPVCLWRLSFLKLVSRFPNYKNSYLYSL